MVREQAVTIESDAWIRRMWVRANVHTDPLQQPGDHR